MRLETPINGHTNVGPTVDCRLHVSAVRRYSVAAGRIAGDCWTVRRLTAAAATGGHSNRRQQAATAQSEMARFRLCLAPPGVACPPGMADTGSAAVCVRRKPRLVQCLDFLWRLDQSYVISLAWQRDLLELLKGRAYTRHRLVLMN